MVGDQVVRAEEDVQLAGDERVGGGVEADAVQDGEDVRLVVVHLGVVDLGQAVLDGEGMEVERVLEDGRFLDRGVLEVDPVEGVRDP